MMKWNNQKGDRMNEPMTDNQMNVILNLVADKFESCKDMEEVRKPLQKFEAWRRKANKKRSPA